MLRQALASIRALEGDDIRFEILVGDNGTSAENATVCAEFNAIHLKVNEAGASASRNAGLKAATGEFLAFLDDDDVWLPGHIRPQLAMLDARPDLEAVIGQVIYTDHTLVQISGKPFPENPPAEGAPMLREMLSGWFPQIGTTVARASIREKIGYFDLALLGGQDLDWLLRIARRRTLGFAHVTCILFRQRAPGSYDTLQYRRIAFDRRVFLRHSLPEWKIWSTPMAFARAHSRTMRHFYDYFAAASEKRAQRGERAGALRAAWIATSVFPLRAARDLFVRSPFRRGVVGAIVPPSDSSLVHKH